MGRETGETGEEGRVEQVGGWRCGGSEVEEVGGDVEEGERDVGSCNGSLSQRWQLVLAGGGGGEREVCMCVCVCVCVCGVCVCVCVCVCVVCSV